MHMTIDIVDQRSQPFRRIHAVSADSDFTPVLQNCGEYDHQTCVVLAGMTSGAYRASADGNPQLAELLEKMQGYAGNQAYMQRMSICNGILQHRAQNIPSGRCASANFFQHR